MISDAEEWKPGSFTKNFSWGERAASLVELHQVLRAGFDGEVADVPRNVFRRRVAASGRPDYIPINFFLFNKIVDGTSYIIADELVFQACMYGHSTRFDKLALFAFNLSIAGLWAGARDGQRYPALWAGHYITDRLATTFDWNAAKVNADDIESFVANDPRYRAKSARKLATNLNFLFRAGKLRDLNIDTVERWWVDALFLTLDRLIEDRNLDGLETTDSQLGGLLSRVKFEDLSGRRSVEKRLAIRHLLRLYIECGGRERFSERSTRERTSLKIPDLQSYIANNPEPIGAIHPTNPRIQKSIPRACAMLAVYAGFDTIDSDEFENFDARAFIKRHVEMALSRLSDAGIRPTMSADELMRLTRGQ